MSLPPRARPRAGWLLVAALVIGVGGCGGDTTQGVRTAVVGRGTVAEVVEAPGTVLARSSAALFSPAQGTVAALRVADGQQVRAGQYLMRIDSPAAVRALSQARAADEQAARAGQVDTPRAGLGPQQTRADAAARKAFAAARAAASAIPDPAARAQALTAAAAAEAQLAQAQAQARAAVRSLDAGIGSLGQALASLSQVQRVQTRAAVDLARRTVAALVIRAPISGVVTLGGSGPAAPAGDLAGALSQVPPSLRGAASALGGSAGSGADPGSVSGALAVGAPVQSGQPLLSVTDVSGLSLTAQVDETDVLLVRPGVTAEADLDAVPGARYAATVRSVDVSPTPSGTGSVAYVVRLALGGGSTSDGGPAPTPRPGMSAVIDLNVRTAKDVVAVPASAVFHDGNRDAVWVREAGAARRRHVDVGAQGQDLVEVRSGVAAGERVVVAGTDKVRTGQRLR